MKVFFIMKVFVLYESFLFIMKVFRITLFLVKAAKKKLNLPHLPKSFSCWTLPHSSNYRPQTTTTTTESSYDPDVLDVDRLEGEDKNREEDMDIFTFTFMLDVV